MTKFFLNLPGVLPREEIHGVVVLPGLNFVVGCAGLAVIILFAGYWIALPASLLAAEVFATILGLFFFGSFKYQIHKNALNTGFKTIKPFKTFRIAVLPS